MVVCINKMGTVNFAKSRSNEIRSEKFDFLRKVSYKVAKIHYTPISGFNGDNLINRSYKILWYKGATLLKALDGNFSPPKRPSSLPLRLPIQDVYKNGGIRIIPV